MAIFGKTPLGNPRWRVWILSKWYSYKNPPEWKSLIKKRKSNYWLAIQWAITLNILSFTIFVLFHLSDTTIPPPHYAKITTKTTEDERPSPNGYDQIKKDFAKETPIQPLIDPITLSHSAIEGAGTLNMSGCFTNGTPCGGSGISTDDIKATIPPTIFTLSWAPGMDLPKIPMGIINRNREIVSIKCIANQSVGGHATIDIYTTTSGTPLERGYKLNTTACNANVSVNAIQNLGANATMISAGNYIGAVTNGSGWSNSVGSGVIQVEMR